MRGPRSLQGQLGLWLGLAVGVVWIGAAVTTAILARQEIEEVFDSALQETAQRLLPLAVLDILGREEAGLPQRLATLRAHEEVFTYVVRDGTGQILLQSHAAEPAIFPVWDGPGFRQSGTHRFYGDSAVRDTIRITVAEPLAHRAEVARGIGIGLGLPLLIVVPVALLAVALALRLSLAPLRRFGERLAARDARDLSPVETQTLPAEVRPLAEAINGLLARLAAAFEAERSFAANAAHELRTPLAGALAQAQRLQAETDDPGARARAGEIAATLRRLTRLSERLMQLARAEGGRLRVDQASDLRPVIRLLAGELGPERIALSLPDGPVLSDLDPDAVAILARNLIDNALRHGTGEAPVEVTLGQDGGLRVANDGPVLPAETLARLTARFERADPSSEGSGLGLAIVTAIAGRVGSALVLRSPRPGHETGFEASVALPLGGAGTA